MPVFPDTVVIERPWSDWIFLRQQRNTGGGGGFHVHNPWGNSTQPQGAADRNRLEIAYRTSGGQDRWGQVVLLQNGRVGIGTVAPRELLDVNGSIAVSGDVKLFGADCAEEFPCATPDIEKGTVMVLGEHGAVRPSDAPYDHRVAGIVSGAGEHRPGIVLDSGEQDAERARVPIALLGKAFCKVDADSGDVKTGDLLTTAERPGHAMKVTELASALGAVLGKALAPLEAGQGLLPVLVTLR
jgi:hypothetical protein